MHITAAAQALMDSRPPIPSACMEGYTNRKTRRTFTALLRRGRLEKLPPALFPFEFIYFFTANYPEATHGQIHRSAH